MHWGYRPNDPQYLYRTLIIDAAGVRFNGSNLHCLERRWQPHPTFWGQILTKGFPRPTNGGRMATPTPRDFELDVRTKDRIAAWPWPSVTPARKHDGRSALRTEGLAAQT